MLEVVAMPSQLRPNWWSVYNLSVSENMFVLNLIASESALEVTSSLYKTKKKIALLQF